MQDMLIETLGLILGAVATGLITLAFAALKKFISSNATLNQMVEVKTAIDEMEQASQRTAGYLKASLVDQLKAASADGKLTEDEIKDIEQKSLNIVKENMTEAAKEAIRAAGLDLENLIMQQVKAAAEQIKVSSKFNSIEWIEG